MLSAILCIFISNTGFAFNVSSVQDALIQPPDAGHEEITRQALLLIAPLLEKAGNKVLLQDPNIMGDFDPDFKGMIGDEAISLITRGNYYTDLPLGIYPSYLIPLNIYWGFDPKADWNNPDGEDLHFLRNHLEEGKLASAYNTCMGARGRITKLVVDASQAWLEGKTQWAVFLIGSATHTLQDSFSPAHAVRAGSDRNNDVQSICYYGAPGHNATPIVTKDETVCAHEKVDNRDYIWLETKDGAGIALTEREWKNRGENIAPIEDRLTFRLDDESQLTRSQHLKHEARLARTATAKFLYLVLEDIEARTSGKISDSNFEGLKQKLVAKFFDGSQELPQIGEVMNNGVMRCDGLSKKER